MIYGIGINDCKGWSNWKKLGKDNLKYRTYILWKGMFGRCYSEDKEHPTYSDCSVCERWLKLSNFATDIVNLPNYELWATNPHSFICLDKDTIIKGNRIYSPEACMFLTIQESNKEMNARVGHNRVKRILNPKLTTKRIVCIFPDGREEEFVSAREAERKYGFDNRHITKCCHGTRKTHKKCKFHFA